MIIHIKKLKEYVDVPENNEEQLLQAVANQPVSVVITIGRDFQMYSGEYGCELHWVTIIGYGTSDDETKYWLIKNSWGENGYVKMLRDNHYPWYLPAKLLIQLFKQMGI
ncbi:hypothetical protein L6164_029652 [Bauhinia variegata]|uniref:Uncharacterized protein n=1 Tax=Bauhinia variegata TaxID=167791 RepID=A0ACB9L9B2_BAUVA|nr:hypothetical protein L6164_029652 [Bauhinia variegata]